MLYKLLYTVKIDGYSNSMESQFTATIDGCSNRMESQIVFLTGVPTARRYTKQFSPKRYVYPQCCINFHTL